MSVPALPLSVPVPDGHEPDPRERRIDIGGVEYPCVDQVVRAGLPTMPGWRTSAAPSRSTP
ncbi:amidase (plasmid) [Streptomyces clavuligerus]|uniref:Amidase n=1 Tax=Streptomyces clavuligerus TaxID=1901 RepID=B5GMD2_STRCL|nr:amidase [Streptomyces clavuligerus]EDY47478.1 hypothetical protein SSCG_00506 [Streptomyces clavuligerus]EFG04441.1 amidase [Streptomyces clavuligerus]QCS10325.1 amidase [Streptomyces clavuligerus]QPJ97631.1 amidase [Streptomyces clavuligerus]